jgi:hypothetical protein
MWESLSGGEDPTADDHPAGTAPGGRPGAVLARGGGPPQPPAGLARGGGPPQPPAGLARGDDQSPGMGAPAPMPPGEPPAG